MTNHDSELPKDVCVFPVGDGKLCGLPTASSRHDYSESCAEFHEPLLGCHPFQPAVADPAPVPMLSCTVCQHPMRFHDDPDDGSHWCLACVSRANEERAAECLEALSTLVKILLKLSEIDDGVMYFNGRYCGELKEPLSRAEAAIAAKDAGNNTVRSSKENPRTGRG